MDFISGKSGVSGMKGNIGFRHSINPTSVHATSYLYPTAVCLSIKKIFNVMNLVSCGYINFQFLVIPDFAIDLLCGL